jgi:hypothetical protein
MSADNITIQEQIQDITIEVIENIEVVTITVNEGVFAADGLSAYEVALQNGFLGTQVEWLASLQPIVINQDNIQVTKQVSINADVNTVSKAQILTAINNIPSYTISETQVFNLIELKFYEIVNGANVFKSTLNYAVSGLGKGNYGIGNIQIIYSNLTLIGSFLPTADDYLNDPTTETIVIEDLGGLDVAQFVNAKNPFYVVKEISEGRTLFATPSGIYLFKLAGGNYGVNGITTTTLADYELLSETATPPTIDAEVLQNSTNAVSGGGVYDFVQPTLEKEVPIITDSFTILDSVDSIRKKLTFDNLINYVKLFFDQSLALFKTANFLDLTSSAQTQIDSKQVKDTQIEVNGSTNVSNAWNGKTILVTASCTITIPATLLDQFMFVGRTLAGVTLTIAITAPFTFETTPTTITQKKTFSLIRRGNTNTILLDS